MTYKKKLIEVALPLATINQEASREKSIRHGHPSTLHVWWARRPLAAARAVLWASLVDDPSSNLDRFPTIEEQDIERRRLLNLLERLVPWESSSDPRVLEEAASEIRRSCPDRLPTILDPFGGGGAIPLESLRLGLPTASGDLNPVAVLIQRAMLQIPTRFSGSAPVNPTARSTQSVWEGTRGLAADIEAYGRWMSVEAQSRIGHHYPDAIAEDGSRLTPIAWLWARTIPSPDPAWNGSVPLVKTWIVSKRPGKKVVWVEPSADPAAQTVSYTVRTGGRPPSGTIPEGRGKGGGECLATGAPIPFERIREASKQGLLGADLTAVVAEGRGGRVYVTPTAEQVDAASVTVEEPDLGSIFEVPGRINVVGYGLTRWTQLFTPRQLLALTTFSDLLADVHAQIAEDARAAGLSAATTRLRDGGTGAVAYADAVVTYLAFVVDKCSDYWSSICSWHNSKEQIRNTFSRQGIPMTWEFAETNPFSSSTGNWNAMVDWVVKAVIALPSSRAADVEQRDASARIREVGRCVVSTDPPYYDNIHYADLSDFFYVWLRRNLRDIWPDELATLLTPKTDELIANQARAGSKKAAQQHFESGIAKVFASAAEHADPDFPATIFYAFKATEATENGVVSTGWETFLRGILDAGYTVSATWPVRTEMGARMIASGTNALASSIVLACRPRHVAAALATRGEFIGALRREIAPAIRLLQAQNIAPVDLAQSAIGPGIAVFSRYAKVVEADGTSMSVRAALALINEVLAEVLSGEESEFDADTRFALTWFEQYGHGSGPFGDADLLAKAKDTTVAGVTEAGVVAGREGKVRLVSRDELPDSWDPALDTRLTVWETTQHLIRALESSETDAAAILRRIGSGFGDKARQLAYLLYGICDRKGWAEEAGPYNMLVTAWPEISRLAMTGSGSEAGSLF